MKTISTTDKHGLTRIKERAVSIRAHPCPSVVKKDGVLSDSLPLYPYLREITDCKTISGTPPTGFRLVLCSEFYTTSIRSTPDP